MLLDTAATEPVAIDAVIFADDGIGVIPIRWRTSPGPALVLALGPRRGEVDRRTDPTRVAATRIPTPGDPSRGPARLRTRRHPAPPPPAPRVTAGALIGIQTPYGTYRFLYPGGDPADLSRQVTAFAVRHQGPAAASSVTRVVAWGQDVERRQSRASRPRPTGWTRVQPYWWWPWRWCWWPWWSR